MRKRLGAIILKDLKAILRNRQIWIPMVILPLIMSVFMPSMFLYGLEKGAKKMNDIQPMLKMIPAGIEFESNVGKIFYVILNFMFPPLFLMIPLMAGSIIGASCLVGEKEAKTLETILYTPISLTELLLGKLLATFLPSYTITLVSFGLFSAVVNYGGGSYLSEAFPNVKWIVLIAMVCPAVILFGLSSMVIISAYASTFQGAQQLSGFVVIPFLMLVVAQTSGAFAVQTWHLVATAPALLLLDYLLISFAARRLTYERLLE